jgi:imidazolonepropionase-like amidohydrolase
MSRAAIILIAAIGAIAPSQDLTSRAARPKGPISIVGATIHPVSGPPIEGGTIMFDGGIITGVAPGAAPTGTVIDARGKHVYPGMIGAVTQLGLAEIASVRASRDFAEVGDVTPEVRAAVAVNPDSTLLPVTRANGVLSAGVFPTGGAIPGRASVIQLEGWTHEDMTVLPDAGVVVTWPSARPRGRGRFSSEPDRSEDDRSKEANAAVTKIEEFFEAATAYVRARDADPTIPLDIRLEAMSGVVDSTKLGMQRPVFFMAQDYDQILGVVGMARRQRIRAVIVGGRDAPLLADVLKSHSIPVIVSGTFKLPKRGDSPYDDAYTLPARLESAGVKWCLASGDETPHERNLPYAAALASAHGLSREAALRSVTLSPAEILGVHEKLGSLDPGKLATLIVTDGDPLEVTTKVERAFIAGREIDLSNKQTRLAGKYGEKYR